MFNEIINAITFNLNDYYGVEVFSEENKQDFSEPCFFIQLLDVHRGYRLQNRHKRVYNFNIRYHGNEGFDELNSVGDDLIQILEYINVDDTPIRGSGISYEIRDGVLHFFISYVCNVEYPVDDVNKMEILNGKVDVDFGKN